MCLTQTHTRDQIDSTSISPSVSLRLDGIDKSSIFDLRYSILFVQPFLSVVILFLLFFFSSVRYCFRIWTKIHWNGFSSSYLVFFFIDFSDLYICLCQFNEMKIDITSSNDFLFSKSTFDFSHLNSWVRIKSSLLFCSALLAKSNIKKFHSTNSSISKAITGRGDMALCQFDRKY